MRNAALPRSSALFSCVFEEDLYVLFEVAQLLDPGLELGVSLVGQRVDLSGGAVPGLEARGHHGVLLEAPQVAIDDPRVRDLLHVAALLQSLDELITVGRRLPQQEHEAGDQEAADRRSLVPTTTVFVIFRG